MRTISFNIAASAAILACTGSKLRMDQRDDTLFIRPTDRKAGPHVLAELNGKKELSVEINEKQFEKLGLADTLVDGATFGLVADKYGWFALRANPAADTKGLVEGAEATVTAA